MDLTCLHTLPPQPLPLTLYDLGCLAAHKFGKDSSEFNLFATELARTDSEGYRTLMDDIRHYPTSAELAWLAERFPYLA